MSQYVAPDLDVGGFTCPHCGAYAGQEQVDIQIMREEQQDDWRYSIIREFEFTVCAACQVAAVWYRRRLVWPLAGDHAPMPNPDLPDEAMKDYLEARTIAAMSPRGAAALLRLAIQRVCNQLVGTEMSINDAIGELVKKGLDERIQQALDVVRVTGNNAVHPGSMAIDENPQTVQSLFELVNIIADETISRPKRIQTMYSELPEGALKGIKRRDAKSKVNAPS